MSNNINEKFTAAVKNNDIELVKLLLADGRVDPAAADNSAISWATQFEYIDVIKLLLADPRVDPSAYFNKIYFSKKRDLKTL